MGVWACMRLESVNDGVLASGGNGFARHAVLTGQRTVAHSHQCSRAAAADQVFYCGSGTGRDSASSNRQQHRRQQSYSLE